MVDDKTKTYSYIFNDTDWEVIQWALANYGPEVINQQIQLFVQSRMHQKAATEIEQIHAIIKAASPDKKAAIMAILEDESATEIPVSTEANERL